MTIRTHINPLLKPSYTLQECRVYHVFRIFSGFQKTISSLDFLNFFRFSVKIEDDAEDRPSSDDDPLLQVKGTRGERQRDKVNRTILSNIANGKSRKIDKYLFNILVSIKGV